MLPAAPQHLTASARVLRAHQHRPAFKVEEAAAAIKDLALRLSEGTASREDTLLEGKLRRATGGSVAELAVLAENWPT